MTVSDIGSIGSVPPITTTQQLEDMNVQHIIALTAMLVVGAQCEHEDFVKWAGKHFVNVELNNATDLEARYQRNIERVRILSEEHPTWTDAWWASKHACHDFHECADCRCHCKRGFR